MSQDDGSFRWHQPNSTETSVSTPLQWISQNDLDMRRSTSVDKIITYNVKHALPLPVSYWSFSLSPHQCKNASLNVLILCHLFTIANMHQKSDQSQHHKESNNQLNGGLKACFAHSSSQSCNLLKQRFTTPSRFSNSKLGQLWRNSKKKNLLGGISR